jgi:hypothetical protein
MTCEKPHRNGMIAGCISPQQGFDGECVDALYVALHIYPPWVDEREGERIVGVGGGRLSAGKVSALISSCKFL